MAADFRVNGVSLGRAAASTATLTSGRLDAELHATRVAPGTEDWALLPPFLYLRAVPVPTAVSGTTLLRIDDGLLDEYDIGLYAGENFDVVGELSLDAEVLRIAGTVMLSPAVSWSIEVTTPVRR